MSKTRKTKECEAIRRKCQQKLRRQPEVDFDDKMEPEVNLQNDTALMQASFPSILVSNNDIKVWSFFINQ